MKSTKSADIEVENIEEELRKHYNGLARQYTDIFFEDRTDAAWLDKFALSLPGSADVLDVGCGPGNFTSYLARKGLSVTGIDISEEMIRIARNKVPQAVFIVMNMRDLKFESDTFSGVLAAYSFLHVPRAYAPSTLLEFRRILRPDGVLALIVKRGKGAHNLQSPIAPGEYCFAQLWDRKELLRIAKESGFQLMEEDCSSPKLKEELQFEKMFFLLKKRRNR